MIKSDVINQLCGILSILGGIYGLLVAYHILPRNPSPVVRDRIWNPKACKIWKIIGPIIIIGGILFVAGILP